MQFSRMDIMDEQRFDPTKKVASATAKPKAENVLDEEVDLSLRKTRSTADILDSQRFDPAKKTSQQQDDSRSSLPDSSDDLSLSDEFIVIDHLEAQLPATPVDATVVRKCISRVLSFDKALPLRPSTSSSASGGTSSESSSRPSSLASTPESTPSSSLQITENPTESESDDIHPDSYISTRMIIQRTPSKLSFDALSCCSGSAFEDEVDVEVRRSKEDKAISVWVEQESSSIQEDFCSLYNVQCRNIIQVESRVGRG